MNKTAIKKYAIWARRELIDRVTKKALFYGISADCNADPKAESVDGKILTEIEKKQRASLIKRIAEHGYDQTVEEVAYTWFNRFSALRFMEVNEFLPSHVRIFTNDAGEFKPQILTEAIHLELDGLDVKKIYELKDANKTEELFRYLVTVQCNALNKILPKMFQRINDYTELLLPNNLLREGSVIEKLISEIPENDWRDQVQIIGWLYQYYNSEPKDKVFADLKKNIKVSKEKIPAATQLFTPDWIVRYMVENSLGRLWLEGHQSEKLKNDWKYFLPDAQQSDEVQKKISDLRKKFSALNPEEIRCIDPCMGSGHILCYLFDVLFQIYQDYGYNSRDAVALILEKNLYGLDIDDRAAQLAYFAVMMKARHYDRRFFSRNIQPNVMAIQENEFPTTHLEKFPTINFLLTLFKNAKEFGSLINVEDKNFDAAFDELKILYDEDCLTYHKLENFLPALVQQAKILSKKFDVVVTNPPYMGAANMSPILSAFVKKNFPDTKSDLSTAFMEKTLSMCKENGFMAMINIPVWMFISSYEKLRRSVLKKNTYSSMLHLGRGIFGSDFGTTAFVIFKSRIENFLGNYRRLFEKQGAVDSVEVKEQKFFSGQGNFFAAQENFSKIPGAPVAYWVSEKIIDAFENKKIYEISHSPSQNVTGNNERFVRFHWELNKNIVNVKDNWIFYAKGGEYRRWWGNLYNVVNWTPEARKIYQLGDGHHASQIINREYWYMRGITWGLITSSIPSFRVMPQGATFDKGGSTVIIDDEYFFYVLGLLNSKIYIAIVQILNPTLNAQVRDIRNMPLLIDEKRPQIEKLVEENISISKTDWDSRETSWDFERHPLLLEKFNLISESFKAWEKDCKERFDKLKRNEEELNRIFIEIYGLQDELTAEVADKDITVGKADLSRDIKSFISYAVGCIMGRYSIDLPGLIYAGGDFDERKYKSFLPNEDAILPICDDEYFENDIVNRFAEFVKIVYGEKNLEENLNFIAEALGGKGNSREVIRNYFLTNFYADHVKTYQKRPIYWLFDSGKKNGFKCLVYMHRYRPDTIARIRTEYVHEQQSRYRTLTADLENRRENSATTAERVKIEKKLAAVASQAKELRTYEEKIHHLADQMKAIDLDDGVKKNYAVFQDVLAKIK